MSVKEAPARISIIKDPGLAPQGYNKLNITRLRISKFMHQKNSKKLWKIILKK